MPRGLVTSFWTYSRVKVSVVPAGAAVVRGGTVGALIADGAVLRSAVVSVMGFSFRRGADGDRHGRACHALDLYRAVAQVLENLLAAHADGELLEAGGADQHERAAAAVDQRVRLGRQAAA